MAGVKWLVRTGHIWRKVTHGWSLCFDTRRARHATKRSRIDARWVTTLACYEDYKEEYSMKIKDVVTEKGFGAFICYTTMLITWIPSQSMEKYTTRVEIEAIWPVEMCCRDNKGKFPYLWKKSSDGTTIASDCCWCCAQQPLWRRCSALYLEEHGGWNKVTTNWY